MSGSIGRSVTTVLCGGAADSVNGERGEIERNYAKMFHVKHRGAGGCVGGAEKMVSRETSRGWAALRGLGPESSYAKMFHVKHRADGAPVRKTRKLQNNPMH